MVDDKKWSYEVLKRKGFQVPTGECFYREGHQKQEDFLQLMIQYADSLGFPVFTKPNSASCGEDASIIFSREDLEGYVRGLQDNHNILHVQEPITKQEYRIFVVDGEIHFSYLKQRPYVKGDGSSSLEELAKKGDFDLNLGILRKQIKDSDYIPEKAETIWLASNGNVGTSNSLDLIDNKSLNRKMYHWIRSLSEAIKLRVYGVDIFSGNITKEFEEPIICEVNALPALSRLFDKGYKEVTRKTWKTILEKRGVLKCTVN